MRRGPFGTALAVAAALALAACGGGGGGGGPTTTAPPPTVITAGVYALPGAEALSVADVQLVLAQAVAEAKARNTPSVIAVTDHNRIDGWQRTEPSHAAVAQAIASGAADAGLAIEAVARARNLGFVPLVQETYYLVCLRSALEQPPMLALREVLGSPAWQARIAQLAGYAPYRSGEVLSLKQQLPWWRYPRPKQPRNQ